MRSDNGYVLVAEDAVVTLRTLEEVVQFGTPPMIESFVHENRCDIDSIGESGLAPLHIAAEMGRPDKIEALLACGAKVDVRDAEDRTPLHFASGRQGASNALQAIGSLFGMEVSSYSRCVERLVDAGANVNSQDTSGWTPLHYAADKKNSMVVDTLLARGASPHVADEVGMLPQDVAIAVGNQRIAAKLEPTALRVVAPDIEV